MRETCPTLGAFEDLREQASREHKPLSALMPKRFGKVVCDALENAMLEWIARRAD